MSSRSAPLSTALSEALRRARDVDALEPVLERVLDRARARWPRVQLQAAHFIRHVAARLPSDVPVEEALAARNTDDLYLACGCLLGDPEALRTFEDEFLRDVGAYVARIDRSADFSDEVRQALRLRLFTADKGEPRIAEYSGGGALGGWVRVAALRIALNLKRATQRSVVTDHVEDALGADLGPELSHLRDRYRQAFSAAVRDALSALPDRDRALLRLYHVEKLSLEAIAALYAVHLSTVSRWLSRSRAQVADTTTNRVCQQLGVGGSTVQSIAALVMSQVDLSLVRLLGASR